MIRADNPFAPLLKQFLDTNYEFDDLPDHAVTPDPHNPLIFYDRHIASNLVLKNIKRAPWIPKELARICDNTIKEFTAAGHTFVENRKYWQKLSSHQIYGRNCACVADYHFKRVGNPCNAYASKLLFSPDDPAWFTFITSRRDWSTTADNAFCCCGDVAVIKPKGGVAGNKGYVIPPETRSTLENWVLPAIKKLADLKNIFNYEFFIKAKSAEVLLTKMGSWGEFQWEIPTVTGAPILSTSLPPPNDSPIIQSLLPLLTTIKPSRLTSARKEIKSAKPANKKRKLVAPLRSTKVERERQSQYRVNVRHYLQKAWANAVESDATFILFTCGKRERIGIRHRQTQTLYLSDMIDPVQLKDPGYRQMHLGLIIAAIKDRLALLDQIGPSNAPSSKRKEPPIDPVFYNSVKDKATRRKRRRLDPELGLTSQDMDKKTFDDELARRDLVLFYLNYDYFRSPAPSSFRRMEPSCVSQPFEYQSYNFKRKASYPTESYISATAYEDDIGEGAMGLIYRVVVEIETSDGSKHRRNLILKLAIGPKKEQIVHEYDLYKRLAEAGITDGIVGVHGLFHDMETDAMIMIMEDAGMSLRKRAIQKGHVIHGDTAVETTETERDAFVKALDGIHGAHIIHHDLRLDNLMINEDGKVFIIDFDNGEYHLHHALDEYVEDMDDLLGTIGWAEDDSDQEDENGGS